MGADGGQTLSVRSLLPMTVATWPRRIAIALLAAVPVVVAASGGFATAPPAPPEQVVPGELVDLGPYSARFESFFVSDRVWSSFMPDGADAWVGVVVELTVAGSRTESVLPVTMPLATDLDLVGGGTPEHEIVMRDDSLLFWLVPGVPERVAVMWAVRDGDAVPDELTLDLNSMEEDVSFVFETPAWYEDEYLGQVTLPRDDDIPAVMIDEAP